MPAKKKTGVLMTTTLNLTKQYVEAHGVKKLQKATGIPDQWLYKFIDDKIPNPSVNRIEQLFVFLSGKTLVAPAYVA